MNNNKMKAIIKAANNTMNTYGLKDIKIDNNHVHPVAVCTMMNGSEIKVAGLPNTSGTEVKHIAQNIMKRAREAYKMGTNSCAYAGGKG